MNRYRMQFAPQVWKPSLNPTLVSWLRGLRVRHQQRTQRLTEVVVHGAEHLRAAVADNSGVLLMPNHASHADPFTIYMAGDAAGTPLHIMATWHVFHSQNLFLRWLLRGHGCFSVDREANDIGAFRQAVSILENKSQPLVIFPEGEIYHCNDRVTPFREGAAAIAVAAARKATRKIVCVPCAVRYRYVEDPTTSLTAIMGELERSIFWRPREDVSLDRRIYRFAEALLAVKELEYLERTENGPLPGRIQNLGNHILGTVEEAHGIKIKHACLPERVKAARKTIMEAMQKGSQSNSPSDVEKLNEQLDDLFLVVQSFSYPGDYVAALPTIERMAETLDKFEEDVLNRETATIRAKRMAIVNIGGPVEVASGKGQKGYVSELNKKLDDQVKQLLDATALDARKAEESRV